MADRRRSAGLADRPLHLLHARGGPGLAGQAELLTDDEIGRLIRIAVTDLGITEVRSGAPDEQIAELWAGD